MTDYWIQLEAVSNNGVVGTRSTPLKVTPVVVTPDITNLHFISNTSNSLTMGWNTTAGYTYTQFDVYYQLLPYGNVIKATQIATQSSSNVWQIILTGLDPGTYNISVKPVSTEGGIAAHFVEKVSSLGVSTPQVTNVHQVSQSGNSLTINWNTIPGFTYSFTISYYLIGQTIVFVDTMQTPTQISADVWQVTITGLQDSVFTVVIEATSVESNTTSITYWDNPESDQGTTITTTGPIIYAEVYSGRFDRYQISSSRQVTINGTIVPTTSNVASLLYWNHNAFYQNTSGSWFASNRFAKNIVPNSWTVTTDPRLTNPILGLTKVMGTAPVDKAFNILFMAEGFLASEQAAFNTCVANFASIFRTTPPYTSFLDKCNIYRLNVASIESGLTNDHQNGIVKNTFFQTVFQGNRAPVPDDTIALSVAAQQFPEFTIPMLIVNTPTYGGVAVGGVTSLTLNTDSAQTGIHELGHGGFGLADEYGFDGSTGGEVYTGSEPTYPNVTKNTNRATLKWNTFVATSTPLPTQPQTNCIFSYPPPAIYELNLIGLFEGAGTWNCGMYRPQYTCKMRELVSPYCPVCSQIITRVLEAV